MLDYVRMTIYGEDTADSMLMWYMHLFLEAAPSEVMEVPP